MNGHSPNSSKRRQVEIAVALIFVAAVTLLYLSSPRDGNFWWSDAPRHAMDGAFYRDLVREMPLSGLEQFAIDYYLKYPALTILFYPPMFAWVEAIFFTLFGVSHPVAQLSIAFFAFLAAWGGYRLLRRWSSPVWAASAMVLFLGFPEVALWGRQVMLELPVCAFLFWGVHIFLRYVEEDRPRLLYASALLLVGAVYTKQTAVFVLPLLGWYLWRAKGWPMLRLRPVRIAGALFGIGLLPLVLVTLRFGQVNFNSVQGGTWTPMPLFSPAAWSFYARQLPAQLGWAPLILAAVFLVVSLRKKEWRGAGWTFALGWFLTGYLFFSLIALKESRHTVLILLPVGWFALEALRRILPSRIAPAAGVGLASAVFLHTVAFVPVPQVSGYRAAADYIAAHAPPKSTILFSGYRDGSFVFNMRAREDRRDLGVLRADKILLRVKQRRELGVTELGLTEADILKRIEETGVSYVVNQPNFWDDLEAMRRLQRVLSGNQFCKVATLPVTANTGYQDHMLEIYRKVGVVSERTVPLRVELPIIGTTIEGRAAKP
jgi:4-amino-4-deoxy-L-arabinose transferase-like glycosyltransferase